MVDKIKSNGTYEYQGQNYQRKSPAVQAYENTPGTKDAAKKKAGASHHAHSGRHANAAKQDAQGVILDLSPKGKGQAAQQQKETSLFKSLRKLAAPLFQWLKSFWESDAAAVKDSAGAQPGAEGIEPELSNDESLELELTEAEKFGQELKETDASGMELPDLPPLDEVDGNMDVQPALEEAVKSRSLQQLEQALTLNGEKRLARNSDLLTYYDRKGKLVEMDETQKHRVLYGDKNILKL